MSRLPVRCRLPSQNSEKAIAADAGSGGSQIGRCILPIHQKSAAWRSWRKSGEQDVPHRKLRYLEFTDVVCRFESDWLQCDVGIV